MPGPELVLVRIPVLLHEPVRLQGLQAGRVTVGRDMLSLSASSLTPILLGPIARAFRIRAARSTDWIVPRVFRGSRVFGIVESTSRL